MRKLASIQRIDNLAPIEGADEIVVARILGWNVVVKKGEFAVGDLCVYCEIDSIVPSTERFEFLKKRNYRIKTVKLRGQVSQGIAFPLDFLPKINWFSKLFGKRYKIGDDVTNLMGIKKYDPYAALEAGFRNNEKVNPFPSFLHKTDETRVQNLQSLLTKYKGQKFYSTVKIDGMSITLYFKDGKFGICTRNMEIIETEDNQIWQFFTESGHREWLTKRGQNIALQGELYGQGIQGNKYQIAEKRFAIFNWFDIDKDEYLPYFKFAEELKETGFELVPVIDKEFVMIDNIDELVEYSKGKSYPNTNVYREGVVFRPHVEAHEHRVGRVSFKAINPNFLLKYDE